MFREHDGKISVARDFRCTTAQFAHIEPDYSGLPENIIERRYDPEAPGGKPKHIIITADHRQTGGPVPWPEGDAMLARASDYPALFDANFPSPPPAPEPIPREKLSAPPEPTGTTIAALRAEVAAMRRALIDAGVWKV